MAKNIFTFCALLSLAAQTYAEDGQLNRFHEVASSISSATFSGQEVCRLNHLTEQTEVNSHKLAVEKISSLLKVTQDQVNLLDVDDDKIKSETFYSVEEILDNAYCFPLDNGSEITQKKRDKLFEAYKQIDSKVKAYYVYHDGYNASNGQVAQLVLFLINFENGMSYILNSKQEL